MIYFTLYIFFQCSFLYNEILFVNYTKKKAMATTSLPSIKNLFHESWELFVKNIFNMFLLGLINVVVALSLGFVTGASVFMTGMLSVIKNPSMQSLENFLTPSVLVPLALIMVVSIFISLIIRYTFNAAFIFLLDKNKKEQKVFPLIKQGFPFALPLIGLGIVYSLISIGGFLFFLIPAILFGFFFMYALFEMVTEKKSIVESLRGSYTIVKSNFGEILIRQILFALVFMVLTIFIPNVVRKLDETTGTLLAFYSILINMLLTWYGVVYNFTLYKQAKKSTDFSQKNSLVWIVVLSVLGWLMLIPISMGISGLVHTPQFQEAFQEGLNNGFKEFNSESETEIQMEQENDPAVDAYLQESQEYFNQLRSLQVEPNSLQEIQEINEENLTLLRTATEEYPESAVLWYQLGNSLTWASKTGTLEEGLEAMQTAVEIEPDNDVYIAGVAIFQNRMGNYDKAVLTLQEALRIRETNGYTHDQLGDAYTQLKVYDSAREHYERAIELFTESNTQGRFDSVILALQKKKSALPR